MTGEMTLFIFRGSSTAMRGECLAAPRLASLVLGWLPRARDCTPFKLVAAAGEGPVGVDRIYLLEMTANDSSCFS